jgi:tRNA(Ile)-lysidine synthase
MARSRKSVDALIGAALAALGRPPDADRPLAVAWSGGLDSTVLLHGAVQRLGAGAVLALHVHHGLMPQADDWVAHCAARASALGVGLRVLRAAGAPARGQSIEAWARAARYRCLLAAAREARASALATAHHADDQAETLLLALARGCGLDGLTGIAPQDRREEVVLLRPLLALGREALREHARSHALDWVEDPSNVDPRLPRSALRRRVMPELEAVLAGWAAGVPATLQALRDAREIVDARAAEDLAAVSIDDDRDGDAPPGASVGGPIDRRKLAALPGARIDAALRAWVSALGEPAPSRATLAEWRAQLVDGRSAAALQPHGGHRLHRYRDRVWADRGPAPDPDLDRLRPQAVRWSGEPALPIDRAGRLCFDRVPEGLAEPWLRRQTLLLGPLPGSARLRPALAGPSRTLRNLRQEAGLPASLRAAFPGVHVEARLLWAAPFGHDRDPHWPIAGPGIALRWEPAASSPAGIWWALNGASNRRPPAGR